jgi:hypothetical protein
MVAKTTSSSVEERIVIQAETGSISLQDLKDQVTAEWLTETLSEKCPGLIVEFASIDRIVAGCSVKLWVRMAYNDVGRHAGLPTVMVVKAGFSRHSPIMLFTYESEMSAYRDVLPRFPIHSPKCYYAGKSPDKGSAAIIIEDLNLRNARFCHATNPLSYRDAAAVLDALAGFHAKTWNHLSLRDHSFEWANRQAEAAAGLASYFAGLTESDTWARYIGLPRSWAVSKKFHDRDRFMSAMQRLQVRGASQPQVVLMGDSHLGNLYFEQDGTPGFLDFQSRIAPWSQEVAYFMGAALDIADRRAWEKQMLSHYLERLAHYRGAAPSFDDGWRSYCEHLLFGLFVWITNGVEFQTEVVNTANAARLGAAAIDNRTLELLEE